MSAPNIGMPMTAFGQQLPAEYASEGMLGDVPRAMTDDILGRSLDQGVPHGMPQGLRSFADRRGFGLNTDIGIQPCAPLQHTGGFRLESSALYGATGPLTPVQLDLPDGPRSPGVTLGFARTPKPFGQQPMSPNPMSGMMQAQPMYGNGGLPRDQSNDSPLYYNVTQGGGIPFTQAQQGL
jgi:hypothetical protein